MGHSDFEFIFFDGEIFGQGGLNKKKKYHLFLKNKGGSEVVMIIIEDGNNAFEEIVGSKLMRKFTFKWVRNPL